MIEGDPTSGSSDLRTEKPLDERSPGTRREKRRDPEPKRWTVFSSYRSGPQTPLGTLSGSRRTTESGDVGLVGNRKRKTVDLTRLETGPDYR